MYVGEVNSGRQSDEAVCARNQTLGVGVDLHRAAAELDHQVGDVTAAFGVGERILKQVAHILGRVGFGGIFVIAIGIDAEDAVAPLDVKARAGV
jgi:hypothetical protein